MKIRLEMIPDVNVFVKSCTDYFAGDIYAKQGKQSINAKSLLGMYSLDLSEPIDVDIETDDEEIRENFYDYIAKWSV